MAKTLRDMHDWASRRAIRQGLAELRQTGFITAPTRKIHYERVMYYGLNYTKRFALVILADGSRHMVVAVGPSYPGERPWMPYQADMNVRRKGKKSSSLEVQFMLQRVLEAPVVWAPRERLLSRQERSILDFWGYSLGVRRQKQLLKLIRVRKDTSESQP